MALALRKILIVEDDMAYGTLLQNWFRKNQFDTVWSMRMTDARQHLSQTEFQLILSDLRLPDGDGIMLLSWLKECGITTPVVIMTGYADIPSAVSAIQLGASDYLEKPIVPELLKQKIETLCSRPTPPAYKPTAMPDPVPISGESAAAQKMDQYIRLVAPTPMTVLLLGESGTGKEFAARQIHRQSLRHTQPFIAVDCGSLSKDLAPSELFGHLKGSFTTALSDKKGVFEQANGGTVFLDEVGNLSYDVQIQLLRALQEQKIRRVGSATDLAVDVRIIAATNEDLEQAIAQGQFREDLYHRLNEFMVTLPPLRERHGDIPVFARHFLQQANKELCKNLLDFSPESILQLEQYHWSGNLRELKNVVRRAVLFARDTQILPENLPLLPASVRQPDWLSGDEEKSRIEAALARARGNKAMAARLLQIDRKTLYNKLHALGMMQKP